MILIDATYIHESGGKVLLEYFMHAIKKSRYPFFLLLHDRIQTDCIADIPATAYQKIGVSENERRRFYRSLGEEINSIFCFANVPPPVKQTKRKVFVFFQNRLLLTGLSERNFYSLGQKLNFIAKRTYIRLKNRPSYHWIVQTENMKRSLAITMDIAPGRIHTLPFFEMPQRQSVLDDSSRQDFIYVADGVQQKNHATLLKAWALLFHQYHVSPVLHLTVPDRFTEICTAIQQYRQQGLNIINHGVLPKEKLDDLYRQCGCLVFPSLSESFGLPLIEAATAGCAVLAADMPYVHEVIVPTGVFDPYHAEAIAEQIIRWSMVKTVAPARVIVKDHMDELIQCLTHSSSN